MTPDAVRAYEELSDGLSRPVRVADVAYGAGGNAVPKACVRTAEVRPVSERLSPITTTAVGCDELAAAGVRPSSACMRSGRKTRRKNAVRIDVFMG